MKAWVRKICELIKCTPYCGVVDGRGQRSANLRYDNYLPMENNTLPIKKMN
jgi:hypothetical protein